MMAAPELATFGSFRKRSAGAISRTYWPKFSEVRARTIARPV